MEVFHETSSVIEKKKRHVTEFEDVAKVIFFSENVV